MKNAIVFGATSGIGKALCNILVTEGYRVAITGRRLEKLEELKKRHPNQLIIKKNDIQLVADVEKVFVEIVSELKTIDLIVQSSGVVFVNPKFEWEQENQSVLTNVLGVTKLYTLAYNLFRKQQFGHLVGITSVASIRGNRSAPVYFASKAYQKAYLESLYIKTKTIKSKKVFITDIRPGFVATKMAIGEKLPWIVPVKKAALQIYTAIKRKKRVAYISKRWRLVAWFLKIAPARLLKKLM